MASVENDAPNLDEGKQTTLDQDLKNIRDAKYDHALEATVCEWIGTIICRPKPADEPASLWLKSGDILCTLMNCIRPGTIPKYNANTKSKFKQMENISLFLRACREVGMLEKDLFSTIDLFEEKDMNTVVLTLFNLGGTIQSTIPYFTGPTIGIKQSNRKFQVVPPIKNAIAPNVAQAAPALSAPIVSTPAKAPVVSSPAKAPVVVPAVVPEVPVMQTMQVTPPHPVELIESLKNVMGDTQPASPPRLPPAVVTPPEPVSPVVAARRVSSPLKPREVYQPPPRPEVMAEPDIRPRRRQPLNSYKAAPPNQFGAYMPPGTSQFFMTSNPGPAPSMFNSSLPLHPVASASYQGYGSNLLRQVNAAAVSQFGLYQFPQLNGGRRQIMPQDGSAVAMEQAVTEWIESVLREHKPKYVNLFQWIQSGEVLCRLVNTVLSNSPNPGFRIDRIASAMHAPSDQLENSARFIHVCKALGVRGEDTFNPNELFEGNPNGYSAALNCVLCLGGVLQNYEWWVTSGNPQLGRRIKIANTQ
jgi:hypothetical protein